MHTDPVRVLHVDANRARARNETRRDKSSFIPNDMKIKPCKLAFYKEILNNCVSRKTKYRRKYSQILQHTIRKEMKNKKNYHASKKFRKIRLQKKSLKNSLISFGKN